MAWPGRPDPAPLARARQDEFYATFYCASVTRCYPGRALGLGRPRPAPREQELCSFWLEQELRLLRPELVVAVGGLAIRRLIGCAPSTASASFERAGATSSRSRTRPASAAG